MKGKIQRRKVWTRKRGSGLPHNVQVSQWTTLRCPKSRPRRETVMFTTVNVPRIADAEGQCGSGSVGIVFDWTRQVHGIREALISSDERDSNPAVG